MLDSSHAKHAAAKSTVGGLDPQAPKYVSAVTLAELSFGRRLIEHATATSAPHLIAILDEAQKHALLEITRHTADEYAILKTKLAAMYLAKLFRRDRPRWLENWVDKATGQMLQVDENDLWICAQARERDLVLITGDLRMERISKADPSVRLLII